jgi:hypothetical protein
LGIENSVIYARILTKTSRNIEFFYSLNASNTGVVKLAAFVRVFAQKVTALPRPRALNC